MLLGALVALLWDASCDAFERAPLPPPLRSDWESLGAIAGVLGRWFIVDQTTVSSLRSWWKMFLFFVIEVLILDLYRWALQVYTATVISELVIEVVFESNLLLILS